ncbi:MAG: polyphosphate kinase 1 [Sandaracinaceae bacterium]|nr:polyphosphate kinase 1 [Sandaracinaceae bacterium]
MDDSFSTRFGAVTPAANSNPEDRADAGREAITPSLRDGNETPIELQPSLFFNRELSWLEFNQRVLDEAEHADVPLLERLKFLTIASANLDEFFMVRVAGLIGQRTSQVQEVGPDGLRAADQLIAISARARRMFDDMSALLQNELLPELAAHGVRLMQVHELDTQGRAFIQHHFRTQVMPVLTPLAIDPGHPFPHLRNRSLNLIAMLSGSRRSDVAPAFAVVQVPSVLRRLVQVPSTDGSATFVLLDQIIAIYIGDLFPGFRCLGAWTFRVVRNFDLSVDEEEAEDLLESVQAEVRRRDRGAAVRLTVEQSMAPAAVDMLREAIGISSEFVFAIDGPQNLVDLAAMAEPLEGNKALRDEPFTPQVISQLRDDENIFDVMAREDLLMHHPYESFDPVVQFVERAALDPHVLAIKQTLYRTSGDSPIVKALVRAAENGKQVTALVEIKARFDEENNIIWARKLEEAGVHVVYGLVGLKTHAKVALIVRREGDHLRRYVHLGTGNYNPSTARLYTDMSFFTARPEFGEDATSLFNLLTSCTAPPTWRKLTIAPLGLHERILGLIEREAAFARAGKKARIVAKMNSLVDPDVIMALYRASNAGVEIDLIVRGICCLRPGLSGVSERIRVTSIVDRFLEHARLFFFEAGGEHDVFASSADWMPRNFQRRIEVMFPIEDERLKARISQEILGSQLEDNVKASRLTSEGTYVHLPVGPNEVHTRCQKRFLETAKGIAEQADAKARRDRPFVVRPVRNRPTHEVDTLTVEPSNDPATSTTISRPPPPPDRGSS